MIRQTVLPFKLERTDETLTAHGGVALLAEYNHGLWLRTLTDQCLPGAGRLAFCRTCQTRRPRGKRIGAYRADSASYQAELFTALEADGVDFASTADQDAAVTGLILGRPEAAWRDPLPGCGDGVAETVHTIK